GVQGLNAGHLHRLSRTGREPSLYDSGIYAEVVELAVRLLRDLAAVREEQHAPAAVAVGFDGRSGGAGLCAAGRRIPPRAVSAGGNLRLESGDDVALIGPELRLAGHGLLAAVFFMIGPWARDAGLVEADDRRQGPSASSGRASRSAPTSGR